MALCSVNMKAIIWASNGLVTLNSELDKLPAFTGALNVRLSDGRQFHAAAPKGILDFRFYVPSDMTTLFKLIGTGWSKGTMFLCFATLTMAP